MISVNSRWDKPNVGQVVKRARFVALIVIASAVISAASAEDLRSMELHSMEAKSVRLGEVNGIAEQVLYEAMLPSNQANLASRRAAAFRSAVSNPSMNCSYTGCRRARPLSGLPRSAQSAASSVAVRNSQARAP
jgi:hypothetical protein